MTDSKQQSHPVSPDMRGYAERSLLLRHGDKTEDELLQRIWNLANDNARLFEQLEALREEVRRFADGFPGDSHDWRWIQNWAKDALATPNPASSPDAAQ